VQKVSVEEVKDYCRAGMAEMRIAVYGWPADVQSDKGFMKWFEKFLLFGETVKDEQIILHIELFDLTKVR
jgi:hypothetical protein